MDFTARIFKKKSFKTMNCRRWSENVKVILPDSIPSNEVEFENMLSINVEVLRYIWGNKKLGLSVSIKLLIESESSDFNKSILKSTNKKIILEDSFCSFNNNGEIILVKMVLDLWLDTSFGP